MKINKMKITGNLTTSSIPYEKSKLHIEIKKELEDHIKKVHYSRDKRMNEFIAIYQIKNQRRVSIEIVVDTDLSKVIYIGVGDGAKGRASIAKNDNGITETVDEVVTIVKNHVLRGTFEKVIFNKSDITKLLEDEIDELEDEQSKELENILDLLEKGKLDKFKTTNDGELLLDDEGLPTLKEKGKVK